MNVKTLCLAILYNGDASGYEIRKLSTDGECAYFVEASFGSIYPALARLEEEGNVTSHVEIQEGRPAKKVYAITENGRAHFLNSLFDDLGDDVYRSEFLLFARFAKELPQSLVETRLRERINKLDGQIGDLRKTLSEHDGHAADAWVIRYGIDCLTVARGYIESHMHELIALARPETARSAAE